MMTERCRDMEDHQDGQQTGAEHVEATRVSPNASSGPISGGSGTTPHNTIGKLTALE